MSDSSSQRAWHFYLDDMIEFADKLMNYTDGLDQAEFVESAMTYDASLRTLDLNWNAVSDITPLSGLSELASVSLRSNRIYDLAAAALLALCGLTAWRGRGQRRRGALSGPSGGLAA